MLLSIFIKIHSFNNNLLIKWFPVHLPYIAKKKRKRNESFMKKSQTEEKKYPQIHNFNDEWTASRSENCFQMNQNYANSGHVPTE